MKNTVLMAVLLLASGMAEAGIHLVETFESMVYARLTGQEGWEDYFSGSPMYADPTAKIVGTMGVGGLPPSTISSNKKLLTSVINPSTMTGPVYVGALIGHGYQAFSTFGLNDGDAAHVNIIEGSFTSSTLHSTAWGTTGPVSPVPFELVVGSPYAAILKIEPVSPTELMVSMGLIDINATGGMPAEIGMIWSSRTVHARPNVNLTHFGIWTHDNYTAVDNIMVTDNWADLFLVYGQAPAPVVTSADLWYQQGTDSLVIGSSNLVVGASNQLQVCSDLPGNVWSNIPPAFGNVASTNWTVPIDGPAEFFRIKTTAP